MARKRPASSRGSASGQSSRTGGIPRASALNAQEMLAYLCRPSDRAQRRGSIRGCIAPPRLERLTVVSTAGARLDELTNGRRRPLRTGDNSCPVRHVAELGPIRLARLAGGVQTCRHAVQCSSPQRRSAAPRRSNFVLAPIDALAIGAGHNAADLNLNVNAPRPACVLIRRRTFHPRPSRTHGALYRRPDPR